MLQFEGGGEGCGGGSFVLSCCNVVVVVVEQEENSMDNRVNMVVENMEDSLLLYHIEIRER